MSTPPLIVHKINYNRFPGDDEQVPASPAGEQEPFSWEQMDFMLDIWAKAIAELRAEWRAEIEQRARQLERRIDTLQDSGDLRSQIGELRGMLSTLINKSADKTIETTASEMVRKVTKRER